MAAAAAAYMTRQLVYALILALAGFAPAAAWGHAVLMETVPADGAALDSAPRQLRLTFNEPVRPVFVRLIDSHGHRLLGPDAVRVRNTSITATLPPLPAGAYIVSWRAVSVDGHPVGGAFTFRVGSAPAAANVAVAATTETAWLIASGIFRFLVYALMLLAAGGALFVVLVLPGRQVAGAIQRYVLTCVAGAAVALVLSLGIEGGLLVLGGWSALVEPGVWRLGAAGGRGVSVALSLLGLALIAAGLRPRAAVRRRLVLPGAIIALAGFGLTGHAATASPRWLMAPVVVLHALTAAFWIGALWPLARTLRHCRTQTSIFVIRRFSRLAVAAVALLVLAGVMIAVVQLGSVPALWQTAYGVILLAKLAAVLALLGLAALNKWHLTPAVMRTGGPASRRLLRSIRAEMLLAAAVLAATAALGTVAPPRALAQQRPGVDHSPAYSVTLTSPPYTARIEVKPARTGVNTITVRLMRGGEPVEPLQATLELSLPALGIEPITRKLEAVEPGVLRYSGPELSLPGRWTLRVEALIGSFEKAIFVAEVPIQ